MNSGFLVSRKGNKVKVTWGAVPEADSYEIYANYCGNKSCVRVGTTTATSTTLKKLNGKKIKTKKFVKAYVIAYKNGAEIGRTILGHAAGPKSAYTNAKAVTADQSAYPHWWRGSISSIKRTPTTISTRRITLAAWNACRIRRQRTLVRLRPGGARTGAG